MKKDSFLKAILKSRILYLDTNIFIYHLEDKKPYSELTSTLFEAIESKKIKAFTSVLTLSELNVGPYKANRADVVFTYMAILKNLKNLKFIPLDFEIADLAAQIRAQHSFKTPDAIHLATAQHSKTKLFLGNDKDLRAFAKMPYLFLNDYLSSTFC